MIQILSKARQKGYYIFNNYSAGRREIKPQTFYTDIYQSGNHTLYLIRIYKKNNIGQSTTKNPRIRKYNRLSK